MIKAVTGRAVHRQRWWQWHRWQHHMTDRAWLHRLIAKWAKKFNLYETCQTFVRKFWCHVYQPFIHVVKFPNAVHHSSIRYWKTFYQKFILQYFIFASDWLGNLVFGTTGFFIGLHISSTRSSPSKALPILFAFLALL